MELQLLCSHAGISSCVDFHASADVHTRPPGSTVFSGVLMRKPGPEEEGCGSERRPAETPVLTTPSVFPSYLLHISRAVSFWTRAFPFVFPEFLEIVPLKFKPLWFAWGQREGCSFAI